MSVRRLMGLFLTIGTLITIAPHTASAAALIRLEQLKLGVQMTKPRAERKLRRLGFTSVGWKNDRRPGISFADGKAPNGNWVQVMFCDERIIGINTRLFGNYQATYSARHALDHVHSHARIERSIWRSTSESPKIPVWQPLMRRRLTDSKSKWVEVQFAFVPGATDSKTRIIWNRYIKISKCR